MCAQKLLPSIVQNLDGSICKIHEISKTDLTTLHIGTRCESLYETYQLNNGKARRIAEVDDKRIFAVASLFKPFIATGVARMINDLSTSPERDHRKFHRLQGAWNKTFTEVFNTFSDIQMERLEGDPSVKQLMVHFKGVYNINHFFLAPNGAPLIGDDDFRDIVSQFTKDTCGQHSDGGPWAPYSNGNFILLALLIEVVSEMPIRDFLREYVFKPLGMEHTYMKAEELNNLADGILAKPYTVSGSGVRYPVTFDRIPFLADTVEFAVAGGHICAADFGKFFRAILSALFEEPKTSWFNKEFANFLLERLNKIDGQDYGYAPCGLVTNLDERLAGSHSLNRRISPKSQCTDYVLGKRNGEKEIKAWYLAGSATGWASTAYLMPDQEIYVIVLTNTSGPLDASDIISQLCLHELLKLQPAKYNDGKLTPALLDPVPTLPDERSRNFYVESARHIYAENSLAYRQLEIEDELPDTPVLGSPKVCGIFINSKLRQSLQITDVRGVLRIEIASSKKSGLMRFVWKDKVFRICSLSTNNTASLAIDRFGAWRNVDFQFEETDNLVTCLIRVGVDCVDRFVRV